MGLVVQLLLAFAMFTGLLVVIDRVCARWTVEDPVCRAQQRGARRREAESRRAARRAHRRGLVAARRRPPDPFEAVTPRRPIQVVAADLRRLSRALALVPAGSPLVRWKALWAAYDQVLMEAADLLEVPHELGTVAPRVGTIRDIERIRLLAALEAAGLVVHG